MHALRLPGVAIAVLIGTVAAPPSACVAAAGFLLAPLPVRLRIACLAALLFGFANASLRGAQSAYAGPNRFVTLDATVTDVDRHASFGSIFVVLSEHGERFAVTSRAQAPAIGDTLRLHGRIQAFDAPRNPGESSPRALASERGLYARITNASAFPIARAQLAPPEVMLGHVRAWAAANVRVRIEEPYATILAGALWGERGALPDDLRSDFQATGTMHVLVTAGLHVGVIVSIVLGMLRLARMERFAVAPIAIAVVWFYAALSGAHLPSLRAATMASFALAAWACGRKAMSWSALAAAALVIAIIWPASIGTVSFALSFSCVAAIVLFAAPISRWLEERRFPATMAEAIALTLATQLGTWPLTANTFFNVAPYAPLANAIVVPLASAALAGGIALLAVTPLPQVAEVVAQPERLLLWAIAWTVQSVSAFPGARLILAPPPAWSIVAYDALAIVSVFCFRARYRFLAIGLLTFACLLVVFAPRPKSENLVVTVLDVGQGDAIVVQTPGRHTILIDAGGRLERNVSSAAQSAAERVGLRTVVPFLERAGIVRIDALIITHPHGDHVGGCAPILRSLPVREIVDAGQQYGGFAYRDCLATSATRHVVVVEPPVGRHVILDDVDLDFIGPASPLLQDTGDDVNENSIVVMLSYQGRKMLFMGDAGNVTEQRLLRARIPLHADILKVGHHGSAYASSPEFLAAVHPSIAIISVGRDNTFGHPAPATIEALLRAGARVYRTDRCGAVTIRNLRTVDAMLNCASGRSVSGEPSALSGITT